VVKRWEHELQLTLNSPEVYADEAIVTMIKRARITIASFLLIFTLTSLAAAENRPVSHTLAKGETLYSVSRKYNVPYEALAAANNITDPTKMKIGTVLVIPSVHKVSKGETLYGIARQYGVSLNELLAANKINASYMLKIDDSLVIPGKSDESEGQNNLIPTTTQGSIASQGPSTQNLPAQSPGTTMQVPPSQTAVPSSQSGAALTPGTTSGSQISATTTVPQAKPQPPSSSAVSPSVPMPEPLKTQNKTVDLNLAWPAKGQAAYLDGKLEGIMFKVSPGDTAKTVASGTVVSAGPSRGFNQVAFVQAKSGYVYVYGGNETLTVKTGDQIGSGKEIGRIGLDAKDGSPIAYFFVFRNGQPIDPALAPRD